MFTTIKKEKRWMKKGDRADELYIIHRQANVEVKYPKDCWRISEMVPNKSGEIDYVEVQVGSDIEEEEQYTTIRMPVEDFWYRNAEIGMAYCADKGIPRSKGLYQHRLYKHRVTSNEGSIKPSKEYYWEDESECSGCLTDLEAEHLDDGDEGYVETSTDEDESRGGESDGSNNDNNDDNDDDDDDGGTGPNVIKSDGKRKLTEEEQEKKRKRARLTHKRLARESRKFRNKRITKPSAGIKGRKFLARTDLMEK